MERHEYLFLIILLVMIAIAILASDFLNTYSATHAVVGAASGRP